MNTSYLKTFVEVVNLRNISKAAEKLYVTQPAVTKQLQILEKEFETVLLVKDGRDMVPTQDGKYLYEYAVNLLNGENTFYNKIKKKNGILEGELNILSSSLPADCYLHRMIVDFYNIYPNITYKVKKVDSKIVYNYIEDGFVNFGFVGSLNKKNKLNFVTIADDELIIAAPANSFSEYKNKSVSLDFLYEHNFISREKGSATLKTLETFLYENNRSIDNLKTIVTVEDNEIIKSLVKDDMGITIISKVAVEKEIKEGSIVPIYIKDAELKRQLYFVYHKDRYFSRIEETFKEYIIKKYSR